MKKGEAEQRTKYQPLNEIQRGHNGNIAMGLDFLRTSLCVNACDLPPLLRLRRWEKRTPRQQLEPWCVAIRRSTALGNKGRKGADHKSYGAARFSCLLITADSA